MADPVVSCVISTASGTLQLNGIATNSTYELESASLEDIGTTWRKHTVDNPWVEGSFTTGAVKENVMLPVNVWVGADTETQLRTATKALTDALDQLRFTLEISIDGVRTTWTCECAEYRVQTKQAFLWARQRLVSAQIPAKPSPVLA